MLGVEDQWVAYINEEDILSDEFRLLSISESADLSLPIAHLIFVTKDRDKMRRYTSPGYLVKIGLGFHEPRELSEFMVISKKMATYLGNDQWIIDAWLILNHMNYYKLQRSNTYTSWSDQKTSSQVFNTVMSRYGIQGDTASSSDKMLWLQHNISDRKFLEEVCSHGWFGNGLPAVGGIRLDGTAIYKPVDLLLKPKGKMGNVKLEEDDLELNEFTITSKDGFLSTWLGKTRNSPIHTIENDIDSVISTTLGTKIADDTGLFTSTRYAPISFENDNVHSNWAKSEAQNLQYKASMSATNFEVMLHGRFRDVSVLDCYRNVWESGESEVSITELSGLWLATFVKHKIERNHYQIEIGFSREKLIKDN
jgi:hypothetical protein